MAPVSGGRTDYSFDTTLTPAVADGRLYIGSYLDQDHNVYCLDAKTGKKLWSYLTGGAVLGTPTVANGTVYVGSARQLSLRARCQDRHAPLALRQQPQFLCPAADP